MENVKPWLHKNTPTLARILSNDLYLLACVLALLAAFLLSAQMVDAIFATPPQPSYALSTEITGLQGATAKLDGQVFVTPAPARLGAGEVLQVGLLSFFVFGLALYGVAATLDDDQAALKQAADKLLLGSLFLFLPVGIAFVANVYIKPPVSWTAPWLLYTVVPIWMVFCALTWFAFTLFFAGFVNGFSILWRRVNSSNA